AVDSQPAEELVAAVVVEQIELDAHALCNAIGRVGDADRIGAITKPTTGAAQRTRPLALDRERYSVGLRIGELAAEMSHERPHVDLRRGEYAPGLEWMDIGEPHVSGFNLRATIEGQPVRRAKTDVVSATAFAQRTIDDEVV